jgi:transposase
LRSLKKNLEQKTKDNPNKQVFFFDESRFGTHSKIGHGWFEKGKRTQVKIKLGFQNFYLYSAININTGDDISCLMPSVNTINMNEYLKLLSQELGDRQAILVMDGAGWHRSKTLEVPHNIEIMYLPPYSPELNPVERFWQYVKKHTIKNRIYEKLDDLKDAVCDFIKNLKKDEILKTCSVNYLAKIN